MTAYVEKSIPPIDPAEPFLAPKHFQFIAALFARRVGASMCGKKEGKAGKQATKEKLNPDFCRDTDVEAIQNA